MRQKVSMDSILTGLFAVMLFLLLFYHSIKEFYPELSWVNGSCGYSL